MHAAHSGAHFLIDWSHEPHQGPSRKFDPESPAASAAMQVPGLAITGGNTGLAGAAGAAQGNSWLT